LGYAHALYAEQARLNALVSILPVGIMFVDPSRQVQFVNPECRRLWGLSESADYTGQRDTDLIAHSLDEMELPDVFMQHMDTILREYGVSVPFDTPLRNGRIIRSRSSVVPDATGERYIGRIWMFEDVSCEHARLHEAHARAERDALTNLYNRRRFEDDLERMFAHAQRNDRRLTLLYFDLDDFKDINDRFGHACGDKVLKEIAHTVMLQARRSEIVYRLGGDEFAILVADAAPKDVEGLARRITDTIGKMRFHFAENEVQVHCSMGIATYPLTTQPGAALELVQHADLAMYQAKHFGKNRWQVFDPRQPLDLGKDSR
jgi:diguanylate cyclase (GGDEF)-like protein